MEGQDKISNANVQFIDEKKYRGGPPVKVERMENTVTAKERCWCGRVHRITRPLRVVELLILAVLFALTIHLTFRRYKSSFTGVAPVLLITLLTIYLFLLSVDLISQIIWRTLPDMPMFVFVVLGFLLFAAAAEGIYIFLYLINGNGFLLSIIILCMMVAVLFLVDVTLMILNWRQACMRIDGKCPFDDLTANIGMIHKPGENYSQRIAVRTSDPLILRDNVRSVTTSVSDYERLSHPDLSNLHKFRKIGVAHRREYIDRLVDTPSSTKVKVIQVQTEPPEKKKVSDVETLMISDVKEEPAQTMPKCPVCASHWDPKGIRRADTFGMCPTFLHLAQGFGMCKCCPATTLSAPETNRIESRTESTSATDLATVGGTNQKVNSNRNSEERT